MSNEKIAAEIEQFKRVMHLSSLRRLLSELSKEDYKKFKHNVTTAIDERDARLAEIEADMLKQAKLIEELRQRAIEGGVDISILANPNVTIPNGRHGKVPQKYCYTDENGKEHYWTGRGRTPVIYQKLIDDGVDLKQYLIEKE